MSDLAIPELDLATATLEELTVAARNELVCSQQHLVSALTRYIRFGEILIEVETRVGSENFPEWCEANDIKPRYAQTARRLAEHKEHLPAEAFQTYTASNGVERFPSVRRALTYLAGLPYVQTNSDDRDDRKEETRRLHEMGLTHKQIGALVGVSENTVYFWLNPEAYKRHQQKYRASQKRQARERYVAKMALKKQREREERDRLAKTTGGELAEAYSLIRKALVALDKAGAVDAVRSAHRCEDAIVAALRSARVDS